MKEALLWICDVQERLFPKIEKAPEVLESVCFLVQAFQKLKIPIVVTEQYPQGLGPTVGRLKDLLPRDQTYFSKTTFSGFRVVEDPPESVIIVGIEAHICILQTVKDLLYSGREVIVVADGVASRKSFDCEVALHEMRQLKARITTAEAILFELIHDASSESFSEVLPLIKQRG